MSNNIGRFIANCANPSPRATSSVDVSRDATVTRRARGARCNRAANAVAHRRLEVRAGALSRRFAGSSTP